MRFHSNISYLRALLTNWRSDCMENRRMKNRRTKNRRMRRMHPPLYP
jgi:hypothetical protein